MGQQQLLLLVLSVVLVGLAVFVGITMWGEASRHDRADDLLSQNLRIAQEAVQWRGRDRLYGGGGGGTGTFDQLANNGFDVMEISNTTQTTEHAIMSASGLTLEIVGVSTVHPEIGSYVRIQGSEIDSTALKYDGSILLP